MTLLEIHPWTRFIPGLLVSFWVGVAIGCAGALLMAGRRIRQLETVNALLRARLRTREKAQHTGTGGVGPVLLVPRGAPSPSQSRPTGRIAAGR